MASFGQPKEPTGNRHDLRSNAGASDVLMESMQSISVPRRDTAVNSVYPPLDVDSYAPYWVNRFYAKETHKVRRDNRAARHSSRNRVASRSDYERYHDKFFGTDSNPESEAPAQKPIPGWSAASQEPGPCIDPSLLSMTWEQVEQENKDRALLPLPESQNQLGLIEDVDAMAPLLADQPWVSNTESAPQEEPMFDMELLEFLDLDFQDQAAYPDMAQDPQLDYGIGSMPQNMPYHPADAASNHHPADMASNYHPTNMVSNYHHADMVSNSMLATDQNAMHYPDQAFYANQYAAPASYVGPASAFHPEQMSYTQSTFAPLSAEPEQIPYAHSTYTQSTYVPVPTEPKNMYTPLQNHGNTSESMPYTQSTLAPVSTEPEDMYTPLQTRGNTSEPMSYTQSAYTQSTYARGSTEPENTHTPLQAHGNPPEPKAAFQSHYYRSGTAQEIGDAIPGFVSKAFESIKSCVQGTGIKPPRGNQPVQPEAQAGPSQAGPAKKKRRRSSLSQGEDPPDGHVCCSCKKAKTSGRRKGTKNVSDERPAASG
ncbi:hypothetical protein F5Y11DRAFT_351048 [Daldinia sp. FL1419]|nr:hypothetical protein F5Y11DRAFT_351048 [Daldinia sp. FL1419]